MVRELFEIAQLLHVTVRNLAAGFVALPDDRWIPRLEPSLARMRKRSVPSPCVDAGHAHAARGEIERGFAPHAAACGQILVGADATAGPGVDKHDVVRFELVANALELGL